MNNDEGHNGWTNYETQRVYLEMFHEVEFYGWSTPAEVRHYAENMVIEESEGQLSLADGYALAFLQNVNWDQIWRALPKMGEAE